ncbi:kazrin [Macrosteles quadrilineatus]|uniref:kazrin n=1 Tax=Macrosteles quadrilineatus TaxID=74068 RepID=UPI0023E1F0C0|nr:kazrin [Macrosteles quadrilineatus]
MAPQLRTLSSSTPPWPVVLLYIGWFVCSSRCAGHRTARGPPSWLLNYGHCPPPLLHALDVLDTGLLEDLHHGSSATDIVLLHSSMICSLDVLDTGLLEDLHHGSSATDIVLLHSSMICSLDVLDTGLLEDLHHGSSATDIVLFHSSMASLDVLDTGLLEDLHHSSSASSRCAGHRTARGPPSWLLSYGHCPPPPLHGLLFCYLLVGLFAALDVLDTGLLEDLHHGSSATDIVLLHSSMISLDVLDTGLLEDLHHGSSATDIVLLHSSMALMRRLLVDAQAKFRRMVDENRSVATRIDGEIRQAHEEMAALREELADTSRRLGEQLNGTIISTPTIINGNSALNGNKTATSESSEVSSHHTLTSVTSTSSGDGASGRPDLTASPLKLNSPLKIRLDNLSPKEPEFPLSQTNGESICGKVTEKVKDEESEDSEMVNGENKERQLIRPPSPIPGPSNKPDFGELLASSKVAAGPSSSNLTTRLRLENDKLKREVSELRKLVTASGAPTPPPAPAQTPPPPAMPDLESLSDPEKVLALEAELTNTRDALNNSKADRKKLKAEKLDLLNQMKQLYATLEDKENELRDFIRSFEQRMRESEEALVREREERERERWSLLRHARDEAERSLSLAAQLDLKDQQLMEARRQLSAAGCLSDQESLASVSVSRGVNGGGVTPTAPPTTGLAPAAGDRGSCSADSGVRGSSDRESGGATSAGGNLSDSTTDVTTPKDCSSPSLSPLNAHSFSRSLDTGTLSRSVEQLSTPVLEAEPVRRGKPGRGSGGRSGVGGTWGSISRVFARSRHRKVSSPNSQDDSVCDVYGRSWSPLTEEGYAEKLRLLREAASVPMERWRAPTVLAWLEIALGMPQYGPRCAENVKSGKVLLELSDLELEVGLGITHPMHRKKLRLAIEEHRHPTLVRYPCIAQLGHTWVSSEWLPDLGLAQYSESFAANMVDARMLDHLSKKELEKYLGVTRKFHQASIVHGIHLLRMMKYDRQALAVRRHQCENIDGDPLVWTNQRFIRWARNIDLGEYADNLKDSGVHGALVVLEPSLSGDTMATALGIPPSRHMIRRHLTTELEALVLPARATFVHLMRTAEVDRRRSERLSSEGSPSLPLPLSSPLHEPIYATIDRDRERDKRRASLRTYSLLYLKKFSSWRSSQGTLSRAFGLKSRSEDRERVRDDFHLAPPPSPPSETCSMVICRPGSPPVRRRPVRRHRRVKSIGDIDTLTVTPV